MAQRLGAEEDRVTGRPRPAFLGVTAALLLFALGCGSEPAPSAAERAPADLAPAAPAVAAAPSEPTLDEHGEPAGLLNYHRWSDRIGGGAQPEGDVAFANLAALGYRVVLSVDGARPDAEGAAKYGLRYVHIPFGYDGVPEEERLEIAKTVTTAEGPVYIHCHHGKHRSAAAIAVACIETEGMTHEAARDVFKTCGTDPKYKGLLAVAENCTVPTAAELARIPAVLPSYKSPGDLAEVMVDVDARWDHLNASKAAAWGVPPSNADVDPPHEALMLWEHFREVARMPEAQKRGDSFLKPLAAGEAGAKALEEALRSRDAAAADAALVVVKRSCTDCHAKYRDN
jgi:protein tyrosine phosphatase (PTP) superfamily phosphohydrolase (DUF442 family)